MYRTKKQRQDWWNSLDKLEQQEYIDKKIAQENADKAEQWQGTDKYCCQTCFHGLDSNCRNYQDNMVCGWWFNPNSEIQGIKYRKSLKEQSLPLFEQATA